MNEVKETQVKKNIMQDKYIEGINQSGVMEPDFSKYMIKPIRSHHDGETSNSNPIFKLRRGSNSQPPINQNVNNNSSKAV